MSAATEATTIAQNDGHDRLVALWEVVSLVVSAMVAEWAVATFSDRAKLVAAIPIGLGLSLMVFSHRQRRESLRDLGFRWDNFWAAVRLLSIPTVIAVALIVLSNWVFNDGLASRPVRVRLLVVPLWALFQQYALQGYINRRAHIAVDSGLIAPLLVGIVFAILHLPSPLLASITLIAGIIWASIYQKQPNLFALAVSHTVISWTLSLFIPNSLAQHLRVGFKYFGLSI
jgi:membrane protease YdiL (CAAX protease family)